MVSDSGRNLISSFRELRAALFGGVLSQFSNLRDKRAARQADSDLDMGHIVYVGRPIDSQQWCSIKFKPQTKNILLFTSRK